MLRGLLAARDGARLGDGGLGTVTALLDALVVEGRGEQGLGATIA